MRTTRRPDIPLNLPLAFWDEACQFRNLLLRFRLDNLSSLQPGEVYLEKGVDPRLTQLLNPLRCVAADASLLKEIQQAMQSRLLNEREASLTADVVAVLFELHESGQPLIMKKVAAALKHRLSEAGEDSDEIKRATPRGVGRIIRHALQLDDLIEHSREGNELRWDDDRMDSLAAHFGQTPQDVHEVHDVHTAQNEIEFSRDAGERGEHGERNTEADKEDFRMMMAERGFPPFECRNAEGRVYKRIAAGPKALDGFLATASAADMEAAWEFVAGEMSSRQRSAL